MRRKVKNRIVLPAGFVPGHSLALGAAALTSPVLTFLEMKAAPAKNRGQLFFTPTQANIKMSK